MEKNLGHATAYGYAKSKGYSGTEEEFAELMADYASVGQSAAQSAEQAAASATSASGSAATASQAAQTATSKASEATTAAGTATTKASEASQSASTASTAATSAGTSAQTATTAASTATTKASEASESAATATTAKTDAETARDAAAQSASEAAASAASIDPDEFNRKIYAAFATDTATGAIASFADGADNIPMKDVLVHIEPVQEGSGDPSPDNVRPITGWTGAKVTRTGKNLLDLTVYDGGSYNPAIGRHFIITKASDDRQFIDNHDGTFSVTTSSTWQSFLLILPVSQAYLYASNIQATSTGTLGKSVGYLDKDFNVLSVDNTTDASWTYNAILNPSLDTNRKYWYLLLTNRSTADATITLTNPQIELGSTATDYEPYSGQTYDITFPSEAGTVYGGTLDVTKGELVVDRAMVDLGMMTWAKHASLTNVFQTYRPNASPAWAAIPNGGIADAVCDIYKLTTSATGGVGDIDMSIALGTGTSTTMYVHDSRFTDVSDFISSVSGSKIVYLIATPITYHLTPQEITSLLGVNNVWADTGDMEVEYRASTKMYIDKKITEAVSALS